VLLASAYSYTGKTEAADRVLQRLRERGREIVTSTLAQALRTAFPEEAAGLQTAAEGALRDLGQTADFDATRRITEALNHLSAAAREPGDAALLADALRLDAIQQDAILAAQGRALGRLPEAEEYARKMGRARGRSRVGRGRAWRRRRTGCSVSSWPTGGGRRRRSSAASRP